MRILSGAMRTIGVTALLGLMPASASQPSGPLFSFLEKPGPYPVGIRIVEQYDYSRQFQPALDELGKPYPGERARPLQTLIWYPAQRVSERPMTVADYMSLAETETSFGVPKLLTHPEQWFVDGAKPALSSALWSVRDAPAVTGDFPVVVYAPSFSAWAWENADLCEYLASYGYIVIAGPAMGVKRDSTHDLAGTDAQARDILFLIGTVRTVANADVSQIGVVGFSWGGLASLFAAARDDRIKALVALEGSMRYFPGVVRQARDVNPQAMTVPLLYIKAQEESLEETARFQENFKDQQHFKEVTQGPNVLNEWTHGDLVSAQMLGLVHPEFNSFSQRDENYWKYAFPKEQQADYGRQDGMIGYAWAARYTREFLDAYLKQDTQAVKFLKNAPSENGVPAHVMTVNFRAATPIPPSFFDSFRTAVLRQGFGHITDVYVTMRKAHPDFKVDAQSLQSWGYGLLRDRHYAEGIEIIKLELRVEPSSSAYFDLAEGYRDAGQTQSAIDAYRHALAIDPGNRGAKERLAEYAEGARN